MLQRTVAAPYAMGSATVNARLLLAPISIAFLAAYSLHLISPLYSATLLGLDYDYDPAYQYLFNGIGMLFGAVPRHIDHPGTPLQTLIALAHAVALPFFGSREALLQSALANPEQHIRPICYLLISFNAAAVWWLGRCVYRTTGRLLPAIFCQCWPLLLGAHFPRIAYLAPESLVMILGTLLLGLLAQRLLAQTPEPMSRRSLIVAGALCGVGLACKINFLPMFGLLLLVGAPSSIAVALSSALLACFIAVAPIFPRLGTMAGWFWDVATRDGLYGSGAPSVISISQIPTNGLTLATSAPFFVAGLVASLICLTASMVRRDRYSMLIDAVLLTVFIAQVVMVLKHFQPHYILPIAPLCAMVMARLSVVTFAHLKRRVLLFLGLAVVGYGTFQTSQTLARLSEFKPEAIAEASRVEAVIRDNPTALILGSYRVAERGYALLFGLSYTYRKFALLAGTHLASVLTYLPDGTVVSVGTLDRFPLTSINDVLAKRPVIAIFDKGLSFDHFVCDSITEFQRAHICRVKSVRAVP